MDDPLLHHFHYPLEANFYPLGFALRLRTNSPEIVECARESWGEFQDEFHSDPLDLCVGIVGDDGPFPQPPVCRSQRHLVTLTSDAHHFGVCDFATGFALCWLTPAILRDRAFLRWFYLEALVYSLIGHEHLAAVHAACVVRDGHGILLSGVSGAGKSTLAYACARRGWTYVADDGSFLVRSRPGRVVVGNPYRIRHRATAAELFPELSDRLAERHPNGKMTIEIGTRDLAISLANHAEIRHVIFLNRRQGARATLRPYPKDAALELLARVPVFGTDEVREAQMEALTSLLIPPVYEFTYDALDSAVDRLEELIREGEAQ